MSKLNQPQTTAVAPDSAKSGLTKTASIASAECHPAETAGSASAAMPAGRPHTNSANEQGDGNSGDVSHWVTSPRPKNQPFSFPVLEIAICEACGAEMAVKRNTGPKRKRFCGTACRVAAYRRRQQNDEVNNHEQE